MATPVNAVMAAFIAAITILSIAASSFYISSIRDVFLNKFKANIERSKQSIELKGMSSGDGYLLQIKNIVGYPVAIISISVSVTALMPDGSRVARQIIIPGFNLNPGQTVYKLINKNDVEPNAISIDISGAVVSTIGGSYVYPSIPAIEKAIYITRSMAGKQVTLYLGDKSIEAYVLEHYECYVGERTANPSIDTLTYFVGYPSADGVVVANETISYGSTIPSISLWVGSEKNREIVSCLVKGAQQGYLIVGRGVVIITSGFGDDTVSNVIFGGGFMDAGDVSASGCTDVRVSDIVLPIWFTESISNVSWARYMWYLISPSFPYHLERISIPFSTAYTSAIIISTIAMCKISTQEYAQIRASFPLAYPIYVVFS